MSSKKAQQLGMNPSTASGRLVKDLLWNYIVKSNDNKCHQCGEEMLRENFSIEHITPWLDSENPPELFFDLNNVSFSHLNCNRAAARSVNKLDPEEARNRRLERFKRYRRDTYTPEKRHSQYLRTGK